MIDDVLPTAELVVRLRTVIGRLSGTQSLSSWITALTDGIALLTLVGGDDAWQVSQLHRELNDVLARAGSRAGTELRLADIRQLLHRHWNDNRTLLARRDAKQMRLADGHR